MSKLKRKEIIDFINSRFLDGIGNEQIKNLEKLMSFINDNNIDLEEFDYSDYLKIYESSDKIANMVKSILSLNNRNILLENNIFYNFSYVYCIKNNISVDKLDEENYIFNLEEIGNNVLNEDIDNSLNSSFTSTKKPDSTTIFIKQLGKYDMYTPEEEKAIFEKLDEVRKLEDSAQKTALLEDIKNSIVEHNLRLVVSYAKKFENLGLSMDDLIQEGSIGLMKAIDKFDVSMGNRFSTYATWWINQSMQRAISEKSRMIRIPVHAGNDLYNINKINNKYNQIYGRDASVSELASELNMTEYNVINLLKRNQDAISANIEVGTEYGSDVELIDLMADMNNTEARMTYEINKNTLYDIVFNKCGLTKREAEILILRFGLCGQEEHTLEEVGKIYNVTRERIRQIESKALKRLKSPFNKKKFEVFDLNDFPSSTDDLEYVHKI